MKDAQKPDHISLNTLISRLKEGRYVIPDFQREFEWKPWDISLLMRSIFMDYYVGSLLLWKGNEANFDALACEPLYGFDGSSGGREHIVLDGQQRLTAMYYTFMAPEMPLPNRANRYLFFLRVDRLMNDEPDEAFFYDWTAKSTKLLNNKEAQYESHVFPLAVLGQGNWEVPFWLQGYQEHWKSRHQVAIDEGDEVAAKTSEYNIENAKAFSEWIKVITEQYQIAYIELDKDLAVDKVCDIFTQINSRGIQLDVFDLINALLKPKGLQLKHLWRAAKPRLAFVDSNKLNVYILQVMSILRQNYCSPKYLYYLLPNQKKQVRDPDGTRRTEILVKDISDFKKRWNAAVGSLESAINLVRHPQEFGVISSRYLPYVSILPVFSALQAQIRSLPANRRLDAQRKIRHWYWASVFTNRYSGSVESTAARDFIDIQEWIDNDNAEPGVLLEFKNRFRNLELRKEVKRGTSVYNGIFNLLILKGARDWMTGNVPQHGDLDDHHIVPMSKGPDLGIGDEIHSILNRTPMSAETNRHVIRDRLPNEYLPELIQENGEAAVSAVLESHFISPEAQSILRRDPFSQADFEEFIAARQRTIQNAIEDLLIKERLDLEPQLRELDQKIETIELKLRDLIAKTLEDDASKLPKHVAQKANDRLSTALRKNPSLDIQQYEGVGGKLEFSDLRELQDTLQSKQLWALFEAMFVSQQMLSNRFNQLAELRNSIRHSRTVGQVAQKEGEAAIIWFEQVLSL